MKKTRLEKIAPLATIGSFVLSLLMFLSPLKVYTLSALDGYNVSSQSLGIFFLVVGIVLLKRDRK